MLEVRIVSHCVMLQEKGLSDVDNAVNVDPQIVGSVFTAKI